VPRARLIKTVVIRSRMMVAAVRMCGGKMSDPTV
jgi:hypothetical protein